MMVVVIDITHAIYNHKAVRRTYFHQGTTITFGQYRTSVGIGEIRCCTCTWQGQGNCP